MKLRGKFIGMKRATDAPRVLYDMNPKSQPETALQKSGTVAGKIVVVPPERGSNG